VGNLFEIKALEPQALKGFPNPVPAWQDERIYVSEILRVRGLLLVRCGDRDQAAAMLLRAIEWSRFRNISLFELRALRDLARLQATQGDRGHAAKELQEMVTRFPAGTEIPDVREAREVLKMN
jgi:hypothetical protein